MKLIYRLSSALSTENDQENFIESIENLTDISSLPGWHTKRCYLHFFRISGAEKNLDADLSGLIMPIFPSFGTNKGSFLASNQPRKLRSTFLSRYQYYGPGLAPTGGEHTRVKIISAARQMNRRKAAQTS